MCVCVARNLAISCFSHIIIVRHITGYQSVQGCPVCVNQYPSHISRRMNLGSRRQLATDSPLRSQRWGPYHFVGEERRGPAPLRTTRLMNNCLRMLREDNFAHVCGFSGPPMFHKRVGFDFVLDSIPDSMHMWPRLMVFYDNILVGGRGKSTRAKSWRDRKMDMKHRRECESLGIFEEVWPGRMLRLPDHVRAALLASTDADITRLTRPFLTRWLHAVGETTTDMLVPDLRRRITQIRAQLRQPGDFMFTPRQPQSLPWRLSSDGFDEVSRRIRSLVFPANTERVLLKGKSFMNLTAAIYKSAKKHLMLLRILPTVLRSFVQALRRGLRYLVLGWRLLEGQVHSFNKCNSLSIEPGGRSLDLQIIPTAKKLMIKGVVMTTGSVPPSTVVPYFHISGHSGDAAKIFGILTWYDS